MDEILRLFDFELSDANLNTIATIESSERHYAVPSQ